MWVGERHSDRRAEKRGRERHIQRQSNSCFYLSFVLVKLRFEMLFQLCLGFLFLSILLLTNECRDWLSDRSSLIKVEVSFFVTFQLRCKQEILFIVLLKFNIFNEEVTLRWTVLLYGNVWLYGDKYLSVSFAQLILDVVVIALSSTHCPSVYFSVHITLTLSVCSLFSSGFIVV